MIANDQQNIVGGDVLLTTVRKANSSRLESETANSTLRLDKKSRLLIFEFRHMAQQCREIAPLCAKKVSSKEF